jgi:hypothetical protein
MTGIVELRRIVDLRPQDIELRTYLGTNIPTISTL